MKTLVILKKEWVEIVRNKLILFNMFLIPAIFIVLPLTVAFLSGAEEFLSPSNHIPGELSVSTDNPLPQEEIRIILLHQSMFMLLMIAVFLPLGIAIYSIIGEKDQRSLEPLLATPIKVSELLLGKCLSVVFPAVLVTWITFAIFATALRFLVPPAVFWGVLRPMSIIALLVLPPLLALLVVTVGLIISTWVNDIRAASQIGGIIVLPIVGLAVIQIASKIAFSLSAFLSGVIGLMAIDILLFYALVRSFQRETILIRWR